MEGGQKISDYLWKKAQRVLTEDGRKIFALAKPLTEGKPTELAIWLGTIQHLLEDDLDLATQRTAELYPELKESDILRLLTEFPLIQKGLEELIPRDEKSMFQRTYEIVRNSYQNPSRLERKVYPTYIEVAAKWWLKNNIESLSAWQEDRFMARFKKQMEKQIQETGTSLICTMEYSASKASRINVHLGGLERTILYPEYMAMIGTPQEIMVQKGRLSHWNCIWKAEIVETETKGEEV